MPTKKENNIELTGLAKDFFFAQTGQSDKGVPSEPAFLFSSDSLSGYGLDLAFQLVKEA